jgi:acetyl-CoA carboxylase carboxyltransferase component
MAEVILLCVQDTLGADFVFAWPTAEIAVMGPEGAANIIFRNEIMSAPDPDAMRKLKYMSILKNLLILT